MARFRSCPTRSRTTAAVLLLIAAMVVCVPAQAQHRPGTGTGTSGPPVALPQPPLVNPGSGSPGGGPSAGSLQPSIVVPGPAPQVKPHAAQPVAPAAAARHVKAWCIVQPNSQACRGTAPPDGGGDSADNECRCGRDRCEQRLQPSGSFQLVCFK
jgi:hypothetical protein